MLALASVPVLTLLAMADSGGAAPLLEKGEKLFRQGDTAGALGAFDEAAKADPRTRVRTTSRAWRSRRRATCRARSRPTSRRSRAGATSPRRTTTWARSCIARGEAAGAATELEAAVQVKPDYAEAQYNLGVARDALGKKSEAIAAYKDAVRLKPADAGYRLNLGAALRRDGRSRRRRRRAQGRHPPRRRAMRRPGPTSAWCCPTRRATTRRRPRSTKATTLKPDFALGWNRLGRVELKRGQVPAAVAAQERARKLEPEERRLRRRPLPGPHRAAGGGEGHRRMPRGGRPRPQEPARPLRAHEGPGRQRGLRGGQDRAGAVSRRFRASSRRPRNRPTPSPPAVTRSA